MLLKNKKVLVCGLAGERSIAWGIAKTFYQQGATLALVCQNERLKQRLLPLTAQCGDASVFTCDVSEEAQIVKLFCDLADSWEHLDCLIHSLAFAPREALSGSFLEGTSREAFLQAHEISSYSLTALAREARPLMGKVSDGTILTLSYIGAVRAIPNYNVMGLAKASLEANVRYMAKEMGPQGTRVNAISAGPIRTLAASGISGFRQMHAYAAEHAPLRRNVTIEDVGNAAAFLCSPLASGVTGEVLYVDAGYHLLG